MADSVIDMTHEDFRKRYELYLDSIEHIKSRQWTVTYYLLVLIAAFLMLYGFVGDLSHFSESLGMWRVGLCILTIVVAFTGTWFHKEFQTSLQTYRINVYEAVFHLSKSFQAFEIRNPMEYLSIQKDLSYATFSVVLLWVGAASVYFVLTPFGIETAVSAPLIALVPPVFFYSGFIYLNNKEENDPNSNKARILRMAQAIEAELLEERNSFLRSAGQANQ
jgi:hypothetical protein